MWKTVKARVLGLTPEQEALLKQEYENFQKYLRGDKSVKLYSATRQQADRLLWKIRRPKPKKDYGMIIRRDLFRVVFRGSECLARIPTHEGSISIPIELRGGLEGWVTRMARLLRRGGEWWLCISALREG